MTRIIHDMKVVTPHDEEQQLLEFDHDIEADVVTVRLGGQEIFGCDWSGNLMIVFQDMIDDMLKLERDLEEAK